MLGRSNVQGDSIFTGYGVWVEKMAAEFERHSCSVTHFVISWVSVIVTFVSDLLIKSSLCFYAERIIFFHRKMAESDLQVCSQQRSWGKMCHFTTRGHVKIIDFCWPAVFCTVFFVYICQNGCLFKRNPTRHAVCTDILW